MIGYVTVGTNDIQSAAKFYDALLAEIGATRFMEMEEFIAWSVSARNQHSLLQNHLMVTKQLLAMAS